MDRSLLVRIFGFPATLFHWDTSVIDRWIWLKKRLPIINKRLKLLDIGCGTGAFTIGLALRGYESLGLSWDERNQKEAARRAKICRASMVEFDIQDVRLLNERKDLLNNFDIVICLETIEHIINDEKVIQDISVCLKSSGRLLLTAPNYKYIPIGIGDKKDEKKVQIENGGHVRIGYTEENLERFCKQSSLVIDEISFCSGFLSQKITALLRLIAKIHPLLGWVVILPLRPLPLIFDGLITKLFRWPGYSICLVAHKQSSDFDSREIEAINII